MTKLSSCSIFMRFIENYKESQKSDYYHDYNDNVDTYKKHLSITKLYRYKWCINFTMYMEDKGGENQRSNLFEVQNFLRIIRIRLLHAKSDRFVKAIISFLCTVARVLDVAISGISKFTVFICIISFTMLEIKLSTQISINKLQHIRLVERFKHSYNTKCTIFLCEDIHRNISVILSLCWMNV